MAIWKMWNMVSLTRVRRNCQEWRQSTHAQHCAYTRRLSTCSCIFWWDNRHPRFLRIGINTHRTWIVFTILLSHTPRSYDQISALVALCWKRVRVCDVCWIRYLPLEMGIFLKLIWAFLLLYQFGYCAPMCTLYCLLVGSLQRQNPFGIHFAPPESSAGRVKTWWGYHLSFPTGNRPLRDRCSLTYLQHFNLSATFKLASGFLNHFTCG